jgi:hypothetical protein
MQNGDWKKGLRRNCVCMKRGLSAQIACCMVRGLLALERGLRANERGLRAPERGLRAPERGLHAQKRGLLAQKRGLRAHERGLRATKTQLFGLFCLMRTIKHLIFCCKSHLNAIVMRYFYCERLVRVGSKQ